MERSALPEIGRLVDGAGATIGTAFVVSGGQALTAFHCVGDRARGVLQRPTVRIEFESGRAVTADVADVDVPLDAALLTWAPAGHPVELPRLPLRGSARRGDPISIRGYPTAVLEVPGLTVTGHVLEPKTWLQEPGREAPVAQLHIEQAEGLPLGGYSGAPVVSADGKAVLGLVRRNPTSVVDPRLAAGGMVLATSARDLLARWPELAVAAGPVPSCQLGCHTFASPYEALADACQDIGDLADELHLASFTGRVALTQDLDSFIRDRSRGWFVVEAEAGVGKTAWIGWLARSRGYAHHFYGRSASDRRATARSLAAQIILSAEMEEQVSARDALSSADPVKAVLADAALRLRRAGRPLVLALDALDERQESDDVPLGLPVQLPDNVYVVATTRPRWGSVPFDPEGECAFATLAVDSPTNTVDLRTWVASEVSRAAAQGLLAPGHEREVLIDEVVDRSEGVWLYARLVLKSLVAGAPPDTVFQLPRGLWALYRQYFTRMSEPADASFLAVMAALHEPATVPMLEAFLGEGSGVRRLISRTWRPFLREFDGAGDAAGPRYSLLHRSLVEFAQGAEPGGSTGLGPWEARSLRRELSTSFRAAQQRIAVVVHDALLETGGLAAVVGRPETVSASAAPRQLSPLASYARAHVVRHLADAGAVRELEDVLGRSVQPVAGDRGASSNWWYVQRRDADALEAYLSDLVLARDAVITQGGSDALGVPSTEVAAELRYALLGASVLRGAHLQLPSVISKLRTAEDPKKALEDLRPLLGLYSPEEQMRGFLALVDPTQPAHVRAFLVEQAVGATSTVEGRTLEYLLSELLRWVREDTFPAYETAVRRLPSAGAGRVLRRLAGVAPASLLEAVAQAARRTPDPEQQAHILVSVAERRHQPAAHLDRAERLVRHMPLGADRDALQDRVRSTRYLLEKGSRRTPPDADGILPGRPTRLAAAAAAGELHPSVPTDLGLRCKVLAQLGAPLDEATSHRLWKQLTPLPDDLWLRWVPALAGILPAVVQKRLIDRVVDLALEAARTAEQGWSAVREAFTAMPEPWSSAAREELLRRSRTELRSDERNAFINDLEQLEQVPDEPEDEVPPAGADFHIPAPRTSTENFEVPALSVPAAVGTGGDGSLLEIPTSDDPLQAALALAGMAQQAVTQEARQDALGRALLAMMDIEDQWHRAQALAAMIPLLPASLLPLATRSVAELTDRFLQPKLIPPLARRLDELRSPACERAAWVLVRPGPEGPRGGRRMLLRPGPASAAREQLLDDVLVALPVLRQVGGGRALAALAVAVVDVGEWWP